MDSSRNGRSFAAKREKQQLGAAIFSAAAMIPHPTLSQDSAFADAIAGGKVIFDARYRFESVDQAGFAKTAAASTLRTRLGYETGTWQGFKALVEFENITAIGDDRYNSGTNGKTFLPTVVDPPDTEVNRAQIGLTAGKTAITVGRQRITIDNQRFVGAVGFRQNEQTYDAVRIIDESIEGLTASYSYIFKVHRPFGPDHPLGKFDGDSHAFTLSYAKLPIGTLSGYAYLIDLENAPLASNKTFGTRLAGSRKAGGLTWSYAAEFAHQSDYQTNPRDYGLNYYLIEVGVSGGAAGLRAGYEVLEGNGQIGFATPLATLHAFQGFADVFLTTPVNGIADLYAVGTYTVDVGSWAKNLKLAAWYHRFDSERGPVDLGDEIDLVATLAIDDRTTFELKFATYDGDGFAANRDKFWASLGYRF